MLYNKKTIPTALTITGGFTILKTQRRLTTEKYATIGGSMVHILICDDDAAFAQDMAKKIQALPAYSPKSMKCAAPDGCNCHERRGADEVRYSFSGY